MIVWFEKKQFIKMFSISRKLKLGSIDCTGRVNNILYEQFIWPKDLWYIYDQKGSVFLVTLYISWKHSQFSRSYAKNWANEISLVYVLTHLVHTDRHGDMRTDWVGDLK